jgi:murein DD-endopeptidase MepM/ murein hydrolase activator NlpD
MGGTLQRFAVRLLLLLAKSFIYLSTAARRALPPTLAAALRRSGVTSLSLLVRLATPLYRRYRRLRRSLASVYERGHSWLLRSLSHRYAVHAAVVALAVLTATGNVTRSATTDTVAFQRSLVSQLVESDEEFGPALPFDLTAGPAGASETPLELQPFLSYAGAAIVQPYLPTTGVSVALRQNIEEYEVQEGDTLAGIATRYRLQLNTVLQANNLSSRSVIRPGQKLAILPIDGLVHTVKRGDQVSALAKRYRVTSEAIVSFNRLPDERALLPGLRLIIPGGRPEPVAAPPRRTVEVPTAPPRDTGTRLLWPTNSRRITQYFTWRHSGVDIGAPLGSPIYAAEAGVVVEARWNGGYGRMVLLRHDSGLLTRYGHATKLLVSAGERVTRGQTIALVGSTGRSTGPHLHFEVVSGGRRVNPFSYTR